MAKRKRQRTSVRLKEGDSRSDKMKSAHGYTVEVALDRKEREILRRLDEIVANAPRFKKSDEIEWTERALRRGLAKLLRMLKGAVFDTVREGKLKPDERWRLRSMRSLLGYIPELVKALDYPAVGLRREMTATTRYRTAAEFRREQLYKLYAALGAVAVISSHRVVDPITGRLKVTGSAIKRAAKKKDLMQIIAEELAKDLRKYGATKRIHAAVEKRAKQKLTPGTLGKYVSQVRHAQKI